MLTHVFGILCMACVSITDVPSRLYAVSHVKGMIFKLQGELMDFNRNLTRELDKVKTESIKLNKNDTACLTNISQAHNETRKLLNMLVEGEHSELETAAASLENKSLSELGQLWGTLAPGGKSLEKLLSEQTKYDKNVRMRITEGLQGCKTPAGFETGT